LQAPVLLQAWRSEGEGNLAEEPSLPDSSAGLIEADLLAFAGAKLGLGQTSTRTSSLVLTAALPTCASLLLTGADCARSTLPPGRGASPLTHLHTGGGVTGAEETGEGSGPAVDVGATKLTSRVGQLGVTESRAGTGDRGTYTTCGLETLSINGKPFGDTGNLSMVACDASRDTLTRAAAAACRSEGSDESRDTMCCG